MAESPESEQRMSDAELAATRQRRPSARASVLNLKFVAL